LASTNVKLVKNHSLAAMTVRSTATGANAQVAQKATSFRQAPVRSAPIGMRNVRNATQTDALAAIAGIGT